VKDPSCHTKDRMGSAKDCKGGANTGGHGVSAKTLGHETVSHKPLSATRKAMRLYDLGAAAA
jgi:hypothetical protein